MNDNNNKYINIICNTFDTKIIYKYFNKTLDNYIIICNNTKQ